MLRITHDWTYVWYVDIFITQSELERVEEEQMLEELQSLREIVHDWFRKQEEIAEVNSDGLHRGSVTCKM